MFLNVPIFTKKGEIKFQNASTLKNSYITKVRLYWCCYYFSLITKLAFFLNNYVFIFYLPLSAEYRQKIQRNT